MQFKELIDYSKEEHSRIIRHFGLTSSRKTKYLIFTKLVEEVGELAEALNHTENIGRPHKLMTKRTDLEGELADIISAALILAQELKIDINKALETKIDKIRKRKY